MAPVHTLLSGAVSPPSWCAGASLSVHTIRSPGPDSRP